MADFECGQLEIGLEFMRWSFAECNNFLSGVLSVQGTCHIDYKEEIMGCFGHHLLDWLFFLQHPLPSQENDRLN